MYKDSWQTIGLVSPTAVPFTSIALGKTTVQITTSVGRSLHTYDLRRGLNLVFVTQPQTPAPITAIHAWRDQILTAWADQHASGLWSFKRGKLIQKYELPQGHIVQVLKTLGPWIVGLCQTSIVVWSSDTEWSVLQQSSQYTTMCIIPTYLNKVLVGRRDGGAELWNVKTEKLIYVFEPRNNGALVVLEASPALDIVAFAYEDGAILLHNVARDSSLLRIEDHPDVSSISFRTDSLGAGPDHTQEGIMAVGHGNSGNVVFWDLNEGGRKQAILYNAHNPALASGDCGGITRVEFLAGQNVMLTAGRDNALKSWIFDANSLSHLPRILHLRGGHAAPITSLHFLPSNSDGADTSGKWLFSGSRDRSCWAWSVRRDGQSCELSQGHVQKKAKKLAFSRLEDFKVPEVTRMACSMNRDGGMGTADGPIWAKGAKNGDTTSTGWESVITAHRGDNTARTWFWGRKRAGRWAFQTLDRKPVSAVAISPCGTFALVGSQAGSLAMYNLQSGAFRTAFPNDKKNCPRAKVGESGKGEEISGITVDALNRSVISCGAGISFWTISGNLEHHLSFPSRIHSLRSHSHNDLLAFSCSDGIRILDTQTRKNVRHFPLDGSPTDMCFSHDARWIVAATDDILRVWDVPTGHLINILRFSDPCVALTFSHTGEYLATAHANSVGVNLWNNRTLFVRVPTKMVQEDDVLDIVAPTTAGDQNLVEDAYEAEEQTPSTDIPSLRQLDESLQSLSLVPRSRWRNLLHIDAIRARNKPIEPPKKPEQTPFFLPSMFSQAKVPNTDDEEVEQSCILHRETVMSDPHPDSEGEDELIVRLKSLGPSAADIEIRTLTATEMPGFVRALTRRLREKRDYELVQAWMSVFLRIHAEVLVAEERPVADLDLLMGTEESTSPEDAPRKLLREALREWKEVAETEQRRLNALVGYCAGVLSFVRSER